MLSRVVRGELVGVIIPVDVPELLPPYACSALLLRFVFGGSSSAGDWGLAHKCFPFGKFFALVPFCFSSEKITGSQAVVASRMGLEGWGAGGGERGTCHELAN